MRWKSQAHIANEMGKKRTVTRFALFPVLLDTGEYLWLERYLAYQEWSAFGYGVDWVTVCRMAYDSKLVPF